MLSHWPTLAMAMAARREESIEDDVSIVAGWEWPRSTPAIVSEDRQKQERVKISFVCPSLSVRVQKNDDVRLRSRQKVPPAKLCTETSTASHEVV